MRTITTGGVLALLILLVLSPASGREEKPATLDGEWEVVSVVYKGREQKIPDRVHRHTWKIKGRELIRRSPVIPRPDDEQPVNEIVVRPDKEPKEFDLHIGGDKEPHRGIYKFEDGVLTVVLPQKDQERPKEFDATKDKTLTAYKLQRVPK